MDNVFKKQAVPFTQVPNELLYNPDISFKAKGLWAYMSAKPDGWSFSAARIAEETKEERKAIQAGLRELSDHGYITAKKLSSGRIEYMLHWEPSKAPKMAVEATEPAETVNVTSEPQKATTERSARPKRENFATEEEWEKAFYKWNNAVV